MPPKAPGVIGLASEVLRVLLSAAVMWAAASAIITALNFPYDVDPVEDVSANPELKRYYQQSYRPPDGAQRRPKSGDDSAYSKTAREAALALGIFDEVCAFVKDYGLEKKRVLEVGAGQGLLQDMVEDYTALDISPSVARFFHKRFVEGSATAMPFPDGAFDALWSIWLLEHVPNPERALSEMRRVVKNGGYILLHPAWNCRPWAADGYEVRPFSDFDWKGKLIKASVPIRASGWYTSFWLPQVRLLRWLTYKLTGTPTRLHFNRLTPNYGQYWVPDSDAAISLDPLEALLWFTSRGDECLNCPSAAEVATRFAPLPEGMVIRVRKQ